MANQNLNPQGYNYGIEPGNINPFWSGGGGGDIGDIEVGVNVGQNVGDPYGYCEKYKDEEEQWHLDFYFENIKGEQGEQGPQGEPGAGANTSFPMFTYSSVAPRFIFNAMPFNSVVQTIFSDFANNKFTVTSNPSGFIAVSQDPLYEDLFTMFDTMDINPGKSAMIPVVVDYNINDMYDSQNVLVNHNSVPTIQSGVIFARADRDSNDEISLYIPYTKYASAQGLTKIIFVRSNGTVSAQLALFGALEIVDAYDTYTATGSLFVQILNIAES